MDWIILPREGIDLAERGVLKLGTPQDEVWELFGHKPEYQKQNFFAPQRPPCEYFGPAPHVMVDYDVAKRCAAIEIGFSERVVFQGVRILKVPFHVVIAIVSELDPNVSITNVGLRSFVLNFAVYAPHDHDVPAEGAMVFADGYYDGLERPWRKNKRTP